MATSRPGRQNGRARSFIALSTAALLFAACSTATPQAAATASPSATVVAAPSATPTPSPSPTPTPGPTPTPTPDPTPTPEPTLKVIGTKTKVGDQQYITVTLVEIWPGTDAIKPAAGKVFVAVNITVDGITATSYDTKWFKVRDAGGTLYNGKSLRAPNLFENTLEAGHTTAGFIIYEVPAAAAAALTLEYTPPFVSAATVVQLY